MGGVRAAQLASPPQGICLCFLAAKFLSGGAPKRNCRLLRTASYTLLLSMTGVSAYSTEQSFIAMRQFREVSSSTSALFCCILQMPQNLLFQNPNEKQQKCHKTSSNATLNLYALNKLTPIFFKTRTRSRRQSFIKTALYKQYWIIGSGL